MRFEEQFETEASPQTAFDFASDFTNLSVWDPTIVSVRKSPGKTGGSGTQYRVRLRFLGATTELDYRVRVYDEPSRAVLVGKAAWCTATDTVIVEPHDKGSRVRWIADIRFLSPLSLFDPILRLLFRGSVEEAVRRLKIALNRRSRRRQRSTPGKPASGVGSGATARRVA